MNNARRVGVLLLYVRVRASGYGGKWVIVQDYDRDCEYGCASAR